VVNPTILGSKSAGSLAASWSIIQALGLDGFASLAASCERSTSALAQAIAGIEGLRIVGSPVGPLLAVTTDETVPVDRRIDPHHWADQARSHGWLLQLQPSIEQADGTRLPRTTHLTITPVTERVLPDLTAALIASADEVRGVAAIAPADVLGSLPPLGTDALDSETAFGLLTALGLGAGGGLPDRMAPLLALMEGLPAPVAERLLTELLARLVEPVAD
jgi:hypothetical protein